VAVVTAAGAGVVAAAIASPVAGVAVAGATLVVLAVPRLRFLLALGAVGCVVVAGIYVAVHQSQARLPDDGAWPRSFGAASQWVWAGVVFLGADGVVDVAVRARKRRSARGPAEGPVEAIDGAEGLGGADGDVRPVR
jgi:hypothetical protein